MHNPVKEIKSQTSIIDRYINVEFPEDAYPEFIRKVCDHLHEVHRIPKEMLYPCAIGIVAGVVGNKYIVEDVHPNYTQTLNQYFLGIGNSSAGKSTALYPLIYAVSEEEKKLMRKYRDAKEQGTNPTDPHRIIEDATQEGICKLMAETNSALFSISTEARQILNIICGAYRKSGNEFSFYNKAWDGKESYRVNRAGKDPLYIENAFLSALWLIQPDAIKSFIKSDENKENGFLQRLLLFKANVPFKEMENHQTKLNAQIKHEWDNFILGLYNNRMQEERITIKGTTKAKEVIIDYYNSFKELADTESEIYGYLSKSTEKACRLTGVLALCDNKEEIDGQTTRNACKIVDYSNSILLGYIARDHDEYAQDLRERILDVFHQEQSYRIPYRNFRGKKRITLEQLEETANRFPNEFELISGSKAGSKIMILKEHN